MPDEPVKVPSVTGPDDLEIERAYARLPEEYKRASSLQGVKDAAIPPTGPFVSFDDVLAEMERVQEENDRKRNAG